jgi:hypothetical protein
MFHSTSHQTMRELDTGSAYRVQFKTSAHHHTLSDMHELVQNHEQELKAHAAVMKQAAERQTQLNAQLQMLYDTRTITRVTGGNMEDLRREHEAAQTAHSAKMERARVHQENLNDYGHKLSLAIDSEKAHEDAEAENQAAAKLAAQHKAAADAAEDAHKKNVALLGVMKPKPAKPGKQDNNSHPRTFYGALTNTGKTAPNFMPQESWQTVGPTRTNPHGATAGNQRNTEEVKMVDPFRKRDHPSRA